ITHSVSEAVFLANRVIVMSARPGRIVADLQIDFPYPRDPDLRYDAHFVEYVAEITETLRGAR
ncbi:MAG: ABC transporter ATP-binding protein, partial [Mycobacterium sp.]|nr:ABC transporter ATP-binding protein [Mycobacterium sp.]